MNTPEHLTNPRSVFGTTENASTDRKVRCGGSSFALKGHSMVPASKSVESVAAELIGQELRQHVPKGDARLAEALAKQPVEPYKPALVPVSGSLTQDERVRLLDLMDEHKRGGVFTSEIMMLEIETIINRRMKAQLTDDYASFRRILNGNKNEFVPADPPPATFVEEPDQSARTRAATEAARAKFGGGR